MKNPEPTELLDWKYSDKMYRRGRPNWSRLPANVKDIVRESLRDEQGGICCYCERFMQADDYHIEHIKPKGDRSPYKHLLAEYDNMLCSCQAEGIEGDPLHCGMGKAGWYDPTVYVSPLDPSCEARFEYTFNGLINGTDPDAETTAEKLKLDLPKLNALRALAIEPFLDEELSLEDLANFVQGYLDQKANNGCQCNPFYTTIKYLFGHLV